MEKESKKHKIMFNCISISPGIANLLDNKKMKLGFKKNKFMKHSLEQIFTEKDSSLLFQALE